MTRDWKPGDVAIACGDRMIRTVDGWWSSESGQPRIAYTITTPRALAVIDPEDRDEVEHFLDRYFTAYYASRTVCQPKPDERHVDALQVAFREYADPKPSKPEEPTGLGAVVEDSKGRLWLRVTTPGHSYAWRPEGNATDYDDVRYWNGVDAVRVLSEGVQP